MALLHTITPPLFTSGLVHSMLLSDPLSDSIPCGTTCTGVTNAAPDDYNYSSLALIITIITEIYVAGQGALQHPANIQHSISSLVLCDISLTFMMEAQSGY